MNILLQLTSSRLAILPPQTEYHLEVADNQKQTNRNRAIFIVQMGFSY
jgi:hypothetical protein